MILASLTTQNFRNLEPAEHRFHPAANILVGNNGQGKTNLLEAIYFLGTTKSFRTARVGSLLRFGATSVFASGGLQRHGVQRTISVGLEAGPEAKRRVLMINEERMTLPAYLNAMSVFAYSSARLEILRGAPEERRRFLDRGIASVQASYLEELTRYTRVLKQRNALLQAIAAHRESPASLDAWDDEFLATAAVVQKARAAYAEDLGRTFAEIVAEHRYHVANVTLGYRPSVGQSASAADGAQTGLSVPHLAGPQPAAGASAHQPELSIAQLRALRRQELRARMSLAGPQRDLIEFLVDGRPASEVLSGGEQKMIVLFLKFAKLELFRRRHDEPPLFLLDDVDAELDLEILQKLLSRLPRETQVFATSAKESFLDALRAGPHRRLVVENGRVTASRDFA